MADKKLRLQIYLPEGKKADEEVDMVIMRCPTGDMGVLYNHEDYSVILDYAIMRLINDEEERWIAVYGGMATIHNNLITVLTREAEWPEEINYAKALEDRQHYQQRLQEMTDDREIQRDQLLLRRALVQIEVATPSLEDED